MENRILSLSPGEYGVRSMSSTPARIGQGGKRAFSRAMTAVADASTSGEMQLITICIQQC